MNNSTKKIIFLFLLCSSFLPVISHAEDITRSIDNKPDLRLNQQPFYWFNGDKKVKVWLALDEVVVHKNKQNIEKNSLQRYAQDLIPEGVITKGASNSVKVRLKNIPTLANHNNMLRSESEQQSKVTAVFYRI